MFVSKLGNPTEQPLEQNNILKEKGRYQSRVIQVAWTKGEGKGRPRQHVNISTSTNLSYNVINCRPSSILAFFNASLFLHLKDILEVVVLVKQ